MKYDNNCLYLGTIVHLYYRGLEQWAARHFDLVKVSRSNRLPATMINFKTFQL